MAKSNFYEFFLDKLLTCARWVNQYASEKDSNRNRTNYGAAAAYADVLRMIGHSVDLPAWEENGFMRVNAIAVDGKEHEV